MLISGGDPLNFPSGVYFFKVEQLYLQKVEGEKKKSKDKYHLTEKIYGSYARSARLPVVVNKDKTKALCKNGVLKILLAKSRKNKEQRNRSDAG